MLSFRDCCYFFRLCSQHLSLTVLNAFFFGTLFFFVAVQARRMVRAEKNSTGFNSNNTKGILKVDADAIGHDHGSVLS